MRIEKGGCPRRKIGASSHQEKRPGRHAREALLLFYPIICRVCGSARSSPRGLPQSRLAGLRDISLLPMICPVRRDQLRPAIGGRPRDLPHHPRGEMRMSNDWPLVLPLYPLPWRRYTMCRRDSHARYRTRSSRRISPARLLPHISERTLRGLARSLVSEGICQARGTGIP